MKRMMPIASVLLACATGNQAPADDGGVGGDGSAPTSTMSTGTSSTTSSASSAGPGEGGGHGTAGSEDVSHGGGPATSTGAGGDGGDSGDGGSGGSAVVDKDPKIIISGLTKPALLRCNGSRIYWINREKGDVFHARTDGSDVGELSIDAAPLATDAAIAGTGILFAINGSSPRLVRVPLSGGDAEIIGTGSGYRGLYVHGSDLYWFDDHQIVGPSGIVHQTENSISNIAVDGSGVYYGDNRGVWTVPATGGVSRRIVQLTSSPQDMQLDDNYVVYGTTAALMQVTKEVGLPATLSASPASRISISGDVFAWMGNAKVYTMKRGEYEREVAPYNGLGDIAVCDGYAFWASTNDGVIVRVAP